MERVIFYAMLCFLFVSFQLKAQENDTVQIQTDIVSLGLGFGQDYGGSGFHMIVYPNRNLGIFGGLGYRLDGLGYNVGIKVRYIPKRLTEKVTPYAIAMYGYNAALVVGDILSAYLHEYDKMFYGPTVGVGIDLKFKPMSKFYYSFGLNIPIRGPQVNDYVEDLRANRGIDASNDLSPVTLSIGIKYIVLRK